MSHASKGQGGPRESLGAFAPRTMSAETEARDRRAAMASERPLALLAVRAYAELDAERTAHARTLAALAEIVALSGDGPHGERDEWTEAAAFTDAQLIARAAISAARSEVRP